jgi:prefoldin subunit 5
LDQGFNVTPLLIALGQAVPVWAIVAFAVTYYLRKSKDSRDDLDKRLVSIETDIHRIQLSLASAGIDSLERDIEALKESRAQTTVQIDALWKAVEARPLKVAKSRHEHD